ncbi:MAG TPA: hypothetical protein VI195_10025 [Steroidobacteraceae bacterium]
MRDLAKLVLLGCSLFAAAFALWRLALVVALVMREFRGDRPGAEAPDSSEQRTSSTSRSR